jgi:hypothetical protein
MLFFFVKITKMCISFLVGVVLALTVSQYPLQSL